MSVSPPDSNATASPRPGWRERARRLLASPRAPWVIVAVALLLNLPSISLGWLIDDHLLRIRIQAAIADTSSPIPVYPATLWDVFHFAPRAPADKLEFIDQGGLNWMSDPRVQFSFLRPLSAMTHLIDNLLWPESAALAHLQSLAWLTLLLGAVFVLYRRLQRHAWIAALALALYALDDSRTATSAWISNRNALIACFFGVLAVVAHDRWRRDGWRPGRWAGPLSLALALLAGESGVGTLGYLLAYALTLDRAPLRERALTLTPHLLVFLTWAIVYATMGYGVRHSSFYVDPGAEPLRFIQSAATHLPILLVAELSGFWSDICILLPTAWVTFIGIGAAIYLLLFLDSARRVVQAAPEARFWALGALLAALPTASVVPMDRNLTCLGVGVMGFAACFLAEAPAAAARLPRRAHRIAVRVWAYGLVAANLVVAPLLVPLRIDGYAKMAAWIERGADTLPRATSGDPMVIALNPPTEAMLSFAPLVRASRGEPPPGRVRLLATGRTAITLTRESATTLRARLADPYLELAGERLMRRDPFAVGDRVVLSGVTIEITEATPEGWIVETLWRFERPLEDPDTIFLRWSDEAIGFAPFTPPAVGERVTLPAVDMLRAWLGR